MLKKAKSQDSVKLLWLQIDVHLKYEANVTRLCRKALNELNTLYHSKAILKQDETNGISHKVFSKFSKFNFSTSMLLLYKDGNKYSRKYSKKYISL